MLVLLCGARLGLRRCASLSAKSAPTTPGPMDFRGGLLTALLVLSVGNSLCLRFLIATGANGGPIVSMVEEAWPICLAALLFRCKRDPLLPIRETDAAAPGGLSCPLSLASFKVSCVSMTPLLASIPPPLPGAGNSFRLGSQLAILVWKSSKLTDGKKSNEPVAWSDSSFLPSVTDPKLKRDKSLIEGPLRRGAGASSRSEGTDESVKESGGRPLRFLA